MAGLFLTLWHLVETQGPIYGLIKTPKSQQWTISYIWLSAACSGQISPHFKVSSLCVIYISHICLLSSITFICALCHCFVTAWCWWQSWSIHAKSHSHCWVLSFEKSASIPLWLDNWGACKHVSPTNTRLLQIWLVLVCCLVLSRGLHWCRWKDVIEIKVKSVSGLVPYLTAGDKK